MRKGLFDRRTLAAAALVALALPMVAAFGETQVRRVGNLYQWVDATGRVVYGDSPPTVTQSRQVNSRSNTGVQRSFPDPQAGSAASTKPAGKTVRAAAKTAPTLNAAQLAALARLKPELAQALARTAPAATVEGAAPSPVTPTPPRPVAPAGGRSDTLAVAAPPQPLTPGPSDPAPSTSALATVANSPGSVNLGLSTATVVEVAQSEPQLIETELSEAEVVRLRRRSLAIGERRFLERLKGFQTGADDTQ